MTHPTPPAEPSCPRHRARSPPPWPACSRSAAVEPASRSRRRPNGPPTTIEPAALVSGQLTVVTGHRRPEQPARRDPCRRRLRAACSWSSAAAGCASSRAGRCRRAPSSTSVRGSRPAASEACSGWRSIPNFATNRRLYVYYTRPGGDIIVSRLTANSAKTLASLIDRGPAADASNTAQNTNHNGGALAFGPTATSTSPSATAAAPTTRSNNGQDKQQRSSARSCASTSTAPALRPPDTTRSRTTTRSSAGPAPTRSGRRACATRGASRSTVPTETSSSPTSGRTATRRSTAS